MRTFIRYLENTSFEELFINIVYFNSWATDPTDVNAFHTFQENQISM